MRKVLFYIVCAATIFGCSKTKLSKRQAGKWYISLATTECFGKCPVYQIETKGDGSSSLLALRFMEKNGRYTGQFPVDSLSALIGVVQTSDWESYEGEYLTGYSDLPSTILRYSIAPGDTFGVRFESDKAPIELQRVANLLKHGEKSIDWKQVNAN